MSVRVTYEHELEALKQDLKEMAHMVESAIEQTFTAFEDQDYMMAEDVIKGDRTVNDMERAIESRCLSLILRQQPVASDLRQVSTALKVVTDLERIGDHASDIAELILRIKSEHAYHIVKHLPVMAASANAMVHDAIEAFINQDLDSAMEIIERDDEVQGVSFPASGAQDDCQKLCIGQAVRTQTQTFFIGAVLVGQILNSYSFHLSPNYAPLQAQSQENYIYR